MKVWVLAGILVAASAPAAFASELPCTPDTGRRAAEQPRAENVQAPAATPAPAPAPALPRKETLALPAAATESTTLRHHARKHPRAVQAGVPDSVLIGESGAL